MNAVCCESDEKPRKPYATIELANMVSNVKPGDEVSITVTGKVIHMEAGNRYPEYGKEGKYEGELKLEVGKVKVNKTADGELNELLEDD